MIKKLIAWKWSNGKKETVCITYGITKDLFKENLKNKKIYFDGVDVIYEIRKTSKK